MDKSKQAVSVYNQIAAMYDNEYGISSYIDDFLNLVNKNGRILDVGCGPGKDSHYIASKGFEVVGVDLSEEMIKIAKKNFPRIDFRIMDMRELSFEPNSFDGIFVAFSFIHLPKKEVSGVLIKLYELLKGGGSIYIAVQEDESKEIFLTEPLKSDEKIFLNLFSTEEIKFLIKRAGFSIIAEHKRKPGKNEFQYNKLFILAKK